MNTSRTLLLSLVLLLAVSTASVASASKSSSPGTGKAKSAKLKRNVGHYEGVGGVGGHPISFDVVMKKANGGSLAITNLSYRTEAECWQDFDRNGVLDNIVVQVDELGGAVEENGDFYIDVTPNEDSWFTVGGTLRNGKARMDVLAGGFWSLEGLPSVTGPYECESWGEQYTASRGR